MTTTLSIRELTRSGKILLDYDYIEIEDKKSHQYKGLFVPDRYAEEVKELIDKKSLLFKEKQKALLLKYAGIADGDIGEKCIQKLKTDKKNRYK